MTEHPTGGRATGAVALVGSESLIGREIRDLISSDSAAQDLKLIAAGAEEVGRLTEHGGEAAFVGALEQESLERARVISWRVLEKRPKRCGSSHARRT